MTSAAAIKPIHIEVTISHKRNHRRPEDYARFLASLGELGQKLRQGGCLVNFHDMPGATSSVIFTEVFQDPQQRGTTKRLNINRVRNGETLDTPGLPDKTEVNSFTQYAKGFLEAKGLLVREVY